MVRVRVKIEVRVGDRIGARAAIRLGITYRVRIPVLHLGVRFESEFNVRLYCQDLDSELETDNSLLPCMFSVIVTTRFYG